MQSGLKMVETEDCSLPSGDGEKSPWHHRQRWPLGNASLPLPEALADRSSPPFCKSHSVERSWTNSHDVNNNNNNNNNNDDDNDGNNNNDNNNSNNSNSNSSSVVTRSSTAPEGSLRGEMRLQHAAAAAGGGGGLPVGWAPTGGAAAERNAFSMPFENTKCCGVTQRSLSGLTSLSTLSFTSERWGGEGGDEKVVLAPEERFFTIGEDCGVPRLSSRSSLSSDKSDGEQRNEDMSGGEPFVEADGEGCDEEDNDGGIIQITTTTTTTGNTATTTPTTPTNTATTTTTTNTTTTAARRIGGGGGGKSPAEQSGRSNTSSGRSVDSVCNSSSFTSDIPSSSSTAESLRLLCSGCTIPRIDKAGHGGEDAFFFDNEAATMGIADGVGAWATHQCSAGPLAMQLMAKCIAESRRLRTEWEEFLFAGRDDDDDDDDVDDEDDDEDDDECSESVMEEGFFQDDVSSVDNNAVEKMKEGGSVSSFSSSKVDDGNRCDGKSHSKAPSSNNGSRRYSGEDSGEDGSPDDKMEAIGTTGSDLSPEETARTLGEFDKPQEDLAIRVVLHRPPACSSGGGSKGRTIAVLHPSGAASCTSIAQQVEQAQDQNDASMAATTRRTKEEEEDDDDDHDGRALSPKGDRQQQQQQQLLEAHPDAPHDCEAASANVAVDAVLSHALSQRGRCSASHPHRRLPKNDDIWVDNCGDCLPPPHHAPPGCVCFW